MRCRYLYACRADRFVDDDDFSMPDVASAPMRCGSNATHDFRWSVQYLCAMADAWRIEGSSGEADSISIKTEGEKDARVHQED
jgi:hypothetical protein